MQILAPLVACGAVTLPALSSVFSGVAAAPQPGASGGAMLAALAASAASGEGAAAEATLSAFGEGGLSLLRLIGPGPIEQRKKGDPFKPGRAAAALERLGSCPLRGSAAGRALAAFCEVRAPLLAVALAGGESAALLAALDAAAPDAGASPDFCRALFGEAAAAAAWLAHDRMEGDAADVAGRLAPALAAARARLPAGAAVSAYVLAPVAWAAGGEWADEAQPSAVAKELLELFAPLAAGAEGAEGALRAWAEAPQLPRLGEPLPAGALVAEPAGRAAALEGLRLPQQSGWYAPPHWAEDASPGSPASP
jgi:hypothetical protein